MAIETTDGEQFHPDYVKLIGSVPKVKGREVSKPAKIGEFPVFVEQSGNYRMFTYSKKLVSI